MIKANPWQKIDPGLAKKAYIFSTVPSLSVEGLKTRRSINTVFTYVRSQIKGYHPAGAVRAIGMAMRSITGSIRAGDISRNAMDSAISSAKGMVALKPAGMTKAQMELHRAEQKKTGLGFQRLAELVAR